MPTLEQLIEENTKAIVGLTAVMAGNKGAAPATIGKAAGKAAKPKHSFEEVGKLAGQVKKKVGVERTKEIISEAGGASALAEVKEDKYDALYAAFEKALSDDDDEDGDGL